MPNSVQSAFSASARARELASVDGSDTDREPARGNVIPSDVNDHRRASSRTLRLHRDPRSVDRNQLAFHDRLRISRPVAHVHPLAVETLIVLFPAKWPLGAGRRDLEVVRAGDQIRVVEQRTDDPADALAVVDGDRLWAVDGDSQGSPRLARLLHRIQLVSHVFERRLDQGFDGRYWPGRHV